MIVSIIAAMCSNRVIGRSGALPWDLPEDLRRFRRRTLGHPLIMGRKTFESIGRALPGRTTIVLSRQPGYNAPGCLTAASLEEALRLAAAATEVFVCGGGEVYRQALPVTERLYLTVVRCALDGDTTFPELPADEFALSTCEPISAEPPAELRLYVRRAAPGAP